MLCFAIFLDAVSKGSSGLAVITRLVTNFDNPFFRFGVNMIVYSLIRQDSVAKSILMPMHWTIIEGEQFLE